MAIWVLFMALLPPFMELCLPVCASWLCVWLFHPPLPLCMVPVPPVVASLLPSSDLLPRLWRAPCLDDGSRVALSVSLASAYDLYLAIDGGTPDNVHFVAGSTSSVDPDAPPLLEVLDQAPSPSLHTAPWSEAAGQLEGDGCCEVECTRPESYKAAVWCLQDECGVFLLAGPAMCYWWVCNARHWHSVWCVRIFIRACYAMSGTDKHVVFAGGEKDASSERRVISTTRSAP
eukprot:1502909-Rhodomonas_salina.2